MIKYLCILITMGLTTGCTQNKNEVQKTNSWYDFSKVDSLKSIYGAWQHVEDSLAFMTFQDSIATIGYKEDEASVSTYKTNYIFDAERGFDKLILVDKTNDTMAYGLILPSVDTLHLIYLDRGNSNIYKRIKP